ncbi:hypothetical protein Scep_022001 [Stephania cephalantha]|uniref:Transposase n=1 Tax=Stephania cephalantha TaxID=152367 RepID=A0AAP0F767_9MAGN
MELPHGLLNSPLPPAPSASPQEGGGATPHIVRFLIIIEYVGENRWVLHPLEVCARRMTKIFKRGMITEGYCWKSLPDHQKDIYWERWKVWRVDARAPRLGMRPDFVTNEAWNRYRGYWASADFKAELVRRREEHTQATPNRSIDEKQLYYDAVGECSKERVYGLVSLAKRKRRYEDPDASTSREPMVRRSKLDAVVQRLAQFKAFVQS